MCCCHLWYQCADIVKIHFETWVGWYSSPVLVLMMLYTEQCTSLLTVNTLDSEKVRVVSDQSWRICLVMLKRQNWNNFYNNITILNMMRMYVQYQSCSCITLLLFPIPEMKNCIRAHSLQDQRWCQANIRNPWWAWFVHQKERKPKKKRKTTSESTLPPGYTECVLWVSGWHCALLQWVPV